MKKLSFLIILGIFACSGQKNESNKSQNETSNTQPALSDDSVSVIKTQKTHLQTLLENGLTIADSSEACQSGKWDGTPQTKLVFNYPKGNKLILEEWEYSIQDHELRLMDFLIYNCNSDQILLQSKYTIANYEIIDVEPSLRIKINADLPSKEGGLKRRPFIVKTFKEVDSVIVVKNEKLFNLENLSDSELNNLFNDIKGNNFKSEETDKIIVDLFTAAVNNNEKAKRLFFNIEDHLSLDGAYSELYGDLKHLLSELED